MSSIGVSQVAQQEIEKNKSGVGIFDLILGLFKDDEHITQVQLREITGIEEDILIAKTGSNWQKLNDVLTNCIVKIGIEVDRQKIGGLVYDMRLGDRTFLLLALRRISLGDRYPFEFRCEDPSCRSKNIMEIDLSELESVYPKGYDPEADEVDLELLRRDEHDFTLPSGAVCVLRVATGRSGYELDRKLKKNDPRAITKALLSRIVSMNGKEPRIANVAELTTRDRDALRVRLDEIDGGVNTTIQVECPVCSEESDVEVNIGSEGFFFPSVLQKRLKRRSGTS